MLPSVPVQLQDVLDREHFPSSTSSRDADLDQSGSGGGVGQTVAVSGPSEGFTVRGAPWSATAAPDTTSMDDFPDLAQVRHILSSPLPFPSLQCWVIN